MPARPQHVAPSSATVVVLPLVPVTATQRASCGALAPGELHLAHDSPRWPRPRWRRTRRSAGCRGWRCTGRRRPPRCSLVELGTRAPCARRRSAKAQRVPVSRRGRARRHGTAACTRRAQEAAADSRWPHARSCPAPEPARARKSSDACLRPSTNPPSAGAPSTSLLSAGPRLMRPSLGRPAFCEPAPGEPALPSRHRHERLGEVEREAAGGQHARD